MSQERIYFKDIHFESLIYMHLNSFKARLIVILRAKRMRKKNGLVPSDNNQYTG